MTGKLTPKRSISKLALIGFFAALGIGSAAIPAVAVAQVSTGEVRGDYRPSGWAPASELEDSGNAPSLTTDLEQPGGGAQLWLGYGLLGAGLLALTLGLAAGAGRSRGAPGRPRKSRHQLGQTTPGKPERGLQPGS